MSLFSALLPIGGSILSSALGAKSAGNAASQMSQAFQKGIEGTNEQFDATKANIDPFIQAGTTGLDQYQAGLGLLGKDAQSKFYSDYQQSPAQQYQMQQGEQAILRNAAATGGLQGGNVLQALQQHGMGIASQGIENQMNRLSGLSGQGLSAGLGLGNLGAQKSANIANLLGQQGQAMASGTMGKNTAMQSGLSGVMQGLGGLF